MTNTMNRIVGRRRFLPGCIFAAAMICRAHSLVCAQENAAASPKITYDDHVRQILKDHCFSCHGQGNAKSDLALDSYSTAMRGGAGGEVVIAGDLETSRLWKLVSHQEEPKMPPMQDKLPEEKLKLIRQWIECGAPENAGSSVTIKKRPGLTLVPGSSTGKPEGAAAYPENLRKEPYILSQRSAAVTAIAASPWASVVAIGGQKQIVLYDTTRGDYLGVLPFPEGIPHVLKFTRNGSLLLAGGGRGGQSGIVALYDVKTGERVFQVGDELDTVLAADINNDHSLIALGGPQKVVRIYSATDGTLQNELKKHTDWIYSIEFSPDGVLLATADRNGGMFVWESATAREFQNLAGHTGGITDISWRSDSNILASASEDTTIRLWEMENGTQVKSWGAHGGGVSAVDFTHDGRLTSTGRDLVTRTWDQNGTQLVLFEGFADVGMDAVFSFDGAAVIAGDWTGEIRLSSAVDGKRIANLLANPPSLAQVAAAAAAELAAAQAAHDQLNTEVATITAALQEKTALSEQATKKAAESNADADKADATQKAADQVAAAAMLAEKQELLKKAVERLNSARATSDKAAADLAQFQASQSASTGPDK